LRVLKFPVQTFQHRRKLPLPPIFHILPQRLLDTSALLKISPLVRLKLSRLELQAGLLHRGFGFTLDPFAAHHLAIAQNALLLRRQAQPPLRVALKTLPIFRRHLAPTLAGGANKRAVMTNSSAVVWRWSGRLRETGFGGGYRKRRSRH